MSVELNVKHVLTLITTITLTLLVVGCGADNVEDTTLEPLAPVAPADAPGSTDRPNFQGHGQAPGFEGGARNGGLMGFMSIISEATSLDPETLREEVASGATLAEIITA